MIHEPFAVHTAASELQHKSNQRAESPKTPFQTAAEQIITHYNYVTSAQSERKLTADETEWAARLERDLGRLFYQRVQAQVDAGYSVERSQEEGAAELPHNMLTARVIGAVKRDLGLG